MDAGPSAVQEVEPRLKEESDEEDELYAEEDDDEDPNVFRIRDSLQPYIVNVKTTAAIHRTRCSRLSSSVFLPVKHF